VLENINKRLNSGEAADARRHHRRALRGAPAGGQAQRGQRGRGTGCSCRASTRSTSTAANAHLSIFGGKLTDCVNVGNEVSEIIAELGVAAVHAGYRWYGEPHRSVYEEYMHQARLMDLDSYTSPESIEQLSSRLWRRYDQQAFELLAQIREDPRQAEVLIKGTDYLRCEIQLAKRQEMIVKLEDFLRRRSKIALVVPARDHPACRGPDGGLRDPVRRSGPGALRRVLRRSAQAPAQVTTAQSACAAREPIRRMRPQ
jgi:glycerol-3-phosphate dehydrogenase